MSAYPAPARYPSTQLGGGAFNHSQSKDAETEYDRLRGLARQEHDKRSACFDKAHRAHERGDGQAAKELSEEGKRHGAMMEQYNKQASDYIFRENNAVDRVAADTIDLHGQFVEEAEEIVEARIKYAQQHGQTHLHVIVGKGNHSVNHIQKLKPKVEEVCRELGLQYSTEENTGRIYINLQGGPAVMPPYLQQHGHGSGGGRPQHGGGGGGGYQQQQQEGGHHGGGGGPAYQPSVFQQQQQAQQAQFGGANNQEAELEAAVIKSLPRILRKLCGGCCTVM